MALALLHETDASITDASLAITDGPKDSGIDCIFVSEKTKKIYLGQSKFSNNTAKGFKLDEFNRFRDGVQRVISLSWDSENADLHRLRPQVERLLRDIDTEVILILAHTSEQALSDAINFSLNEFLTAQNKYGDLISFREFTLSDARETARSSARPENISATLMLKNWGVRERPFKAAYGSVAAADIVKLYKDHNQRLFAENLRYAIEKSEVNDGIRYTATNSPEKFWYFNNGITAICDDVEKLPIGGPSTDSGVFVVHRVSIINGAQTVSALARAEAEGADLSEVSVHMRIISLTGTPDGFAVEVTTANNTQNDLSPVDFVAADINQDRIRREAAQSGLIYTFRRGDPEPALNEGFTIREATIAAACASGDVRLAVASKRHIGGLWENTKRDPYRRLFNEDTTAAWLWKAVLLSRLVDSALESEAERLEGRERLIAVHGNRFVLYTVFELLGDARYNSGPWGPDFDESVNEVSARVLRYAIQFIQERFPDSYPGNIFKNTEKQVDLLSAVLNNITREKDDDAPQPEFEGGVINAPPTTPSPPSRS